MFLSTKTKIRLASMVQRPILQCRKLFGHDHTVCCDRGAITWGLDLREGIDFSIFLFGNFEPSTTKALKSLIRKGDCVIDIGANIGAHTMSMAAYVGNTGRVIAFEPTHYAYTKLMNNISLNSELAAHITPVQCMLSDRLDADLSASICSSWPLQSETGLHTVHGGREMSTDGAQVITLDDYLETHNIAHVDLIKMDVDGYETDVLKGSQNTLRQHTPTIVMEYAPYVLEERGTSADEMLELLKPHGYSIFDEKTGQPLPWSSDALSALVPEGGSRNIIMSIEAPF
ncbi:MAG: FkbM family methyltransferase [Magnetovibrio sp.]|nr:FkbM family methyltransferase [Magnetovibrio sp.]